MNIIPVFGMPGAGKGTQCSLFSQLPNWEHISTGDVLRDIDANTPEGPEILTRINKGKYALDEQMVRYLHTYVTQNKFPLETTILFDGFPRTLQQILYVKEFGFVPGALYINITEEASVSRLNSRAVGRVDDSRVNPSERIKIFREKTSPVIQYYA